ncbi:MAG TPA: MOSC domain-containing protein [Candidatus Thermoplasmatota archaeon]|nr:MOSC domain-containing protein [Candidatus Thermoplasmatota archaeon]
MEGRVVSVHGKPLVAGEHGIRKPALDEARIRVSGVEGDSNGHRARKRNNDPDQAVLLLAQEALAALAEEGWPVAAGDLGENVLTEGLPLVLEPGRRLAVGTAILEVTKRCEPCTYLYDLPYVGASRGPAFLKTLVGRRGWYARVVAEGVARPGDPITGP